VFKRDRGVAGVKRVAIVQSCYVPWKGYFDLINSVDEFILYDECQYTRQDWRNRNRIKTATGTRWLTVPVTIDGLYGQRIDETRIAQPDWAQRHWEILRQAYRTAPHFDQYASAVQDAYARVSAEPLLGRVNRALIEVLCSLLGIRTPLSWSTDYTASGSRTERVVSLCKDSGASVYLSGPRGRDYLDEWLFVEAGIGLEYFDYDGYAEYPQPHPPFEHSVSVLDLLFSAGSEAPGLMKSFEAKVAV
jgi:WbqC-like protein family